MSREERKSVPGIYFWLSWVPLLESMTDDQVGAVTKALLHLGDTGESVPPEDETARVVFAMCERETKDNLKKYEDTCCKRSEAGKKGAAARWRKEASEAKDGKC